MLRSVAVFASLLLLALPARAQVASERLARGDQALAAMDVPGALEQYRAAIAADSLNADALWKAAAAAIDLGEFHTDDRRRSMFYADAERYARRAVALAPREAETHFTLARALGRTALSLGTRERIRYAKDVREHAMAALAIDPSHAGALHVMGVWNAEVMRLNGVSRMIARNFLGGQVFGSASWKDAVSFMERSVAAEPERITHRLDLAKIYLDLPGSKRDENRARAREHLERALALPATSYNDRHYLAEVRRLLATS